MTAPKRPGLPWKHTDREFRRLLEERFCEEGNSAKEARERIIVEWLEHGDPRPFIEATYAGHIFSTYVQSAIKDMLEDGRLKSGRTRGGQTKPGAAWRNSIVEQTYQRERARHDNSDKAFKAAGQTY